LWTCVDTELWADQHVSLAESIDLAKRFLANQDRQHLLGDRKCRAKFLRAVQREFHVHRDNHVHAHRLHDIDGQVANEAAVDEQIITNANRRKDTGHRHAGPDRLRQVAATDDPQVTGFDIGRNCPERDWQLIKIIDVRDRQCQFTKQQIELLPLNHTPG